MYSVDGKELGTCSRRVKTYYPKPGFSERDMNELWEATAGAIREVLDETAVDPKNIIGIGNTGHGNGLYLLDKEGKPLIGIQSLDSRAGQICEEWKNAGIDKKVFPYTLQEFWSAQTNSLLAWIKRNEPKTYSRIGTVFLCKDYINYCLTDIIGSDYTDMGATNLLNTKRRTYDSNLLEFYGLKDILPCLPQLYNSSEIIGSISRAAARQTNLIEGTPVVAGMLDVDASMVGSGVIAPDEICVVAGTWSVNSVVTEHPLENPELAMTTTFVVPGTWKSVEASATSTSNLEWFVKQFCAEEAREAKKRKVSVYEICDEVVSSLPTEKNSILFHPFLYGSNVQATARAGFYGLGGWHTRADMLRAVYEGMVFSHFNHIEKLQNAGGKFNTALLTGGGAKSKTFAQMMADVLNYPVKISSAKETGSLGAAIAAGIGTGVLKDYQLGTDAMVGTGIMFSPNPTCRDYYLLKYKEYKKLIGDMRDSWKRMALVN